MRPTFLLGLTVLGCAATPVRESSRHVAVYRWHVRAGCEARFIRAWEAETRRFAERWGSGGTRLYRADDGSFVATAFWPSREAWSRAHAGPIDVPWAEEINAACIERSEPALHLDLVENLARP